MKFEIIKKISVIQPFDNHIVLPPPISGCNRFVAILLTWFHIIHMLNIRWSGVDFSYNY